MCNSSLNPHVERKTNIFNGFSDYGTGSHCVSVVITTVFPACRHQSWCEKSSAQNIYIKEKKILLPKDTHHILSPAYCCFSWHVPHPKLSLIQRWPCKRVGFFFFFFTFQSVPGENLLVSIICSVTFTVWSKGSLSLSSKSFCETAD